MLKLKLLSQQLNLMCKDKYKRDDTRKRCLSNICYPNNRFPRCSNLPNHTNCQNKSQEILENTTNTVPQQLLFNEHTPIYHYLRQCDIHIYFLFKISSECWKSHHHHVTYSCHSENYANREGCILRIRRGNGHVL